MQCILPSTIIFLTLLTSSTYHRPTVKQDRPAAAAPAQETAAARPPTPPTVEPAADVKSATATILQEWESLKDLKEAELGLV